MAQRIRTTHDVGNSQGLLVSDPREDEARAKEHSARADRQQRAALAAQAVAMMQPAGTRGGSSTYGGPSGDISVGRESAQRGSMIANPWMREDDRPLGVSPGRTIGDNSANNPWAQAMSRQFAGAGQPLAAAPQRMESQAFDGGLGQRPNLGMFFGADGAPTAGGGAPAAQDPMQALQLEVAKEQLAGQRAGRSNELRSQAMNLLGENMSALRGGEGLADETVANIETMLLANPELKPVMSELLKSMGAEGAVFRRFNERTGEHPKGFFESTFRRFQDAPDAFAKLTGWGETYAEQKVRALDQLRRMGLGSQAPSSPSSLIYGPDSGESGGGYQGPGQGFGPLGPGQEMDAGTIAFRKALLKKLLGQ